MSTPASPELTLYRNGGVYSAADPFASAMLVENGVVAWLGSEQAASSLLDSRMRVVDLQGALITPGFVDSHVHLSETGLALSSLDLSSLRHASELLDLVAEAAARGASTIVGHGWDETLWENPELPSATELDRAAKGGRVYLSRVDVHSALVSAALLAEVPQAAGLPGHPDEQADTAAYTHDGGALVSRQAHGLIRERVRAISPAERERLQRTALDTAARAGIVALVEMGAPQIGGAEDLRAALAWNQDEQAHPEILAYWGQAAEDEQHARTILQELGVAVLGLAGDLNIDGSIGSRTALLREDYSDAPGERGVAYLNAEAVAAHLAACSSLGIQGGFHAIGDAALDTAVAGLALAEELVGLPALRRAGHRLEHAEMLTESHLEALSKYAVSLSMQPAFDAAWGHPGSLYSNRLGAERVAGMNPFVQLYRAGIPLAFGSDAPVTPMNPWDSIRACLNHSNAEQRISARAAFIGHTRAGWRAVRSNNPMNGQLVPGASASFAIWAASELAVQVADENVASWSADARARTPMLPVLDGEDPRCLATVHAGRTLYQAPELS